MTDMNGSGGERAVDRVRSEVCKAQSLISDDPALMTWLNDDSNIERFLRAEGGSEHKAVRRLVSTLTWMKEERPLELACPACYNYGADGQLRASAAGHYMHVVTYDVNHRPTIYSCLELASNKDIEDNRRHLISTFELAIEMMPNGVERWNWVLDMHGFRLVDCDPRLAKIFLSLAGDRYPERLGNFWVVDAPGLFSKLWSIIEKFIDPVTKEKIRFVNTKDEAKLRAALASHFCEGDVEFFVREIKENRKVKRGEKTFCYREFVNWLRNAYDTNGEQGIDIDGGCGAALKWSRRLKDIVRHTGGVMPKRIRNCCR